MKIFTLDKEYNLIWEPQLLTLAPFQALFKRDKTKGKTRANSELAFVWFYSDIKSDYQIHTDSDKRIKRIQADIPGLSNKWKPDKIVMDTVDFYEKHSTTITANILKDSTYVANKLSSKMREAVDAEGTLEVLEITKLLDGVKKMPEVIKALQAAEKAVLKEIQAVQQSIGSKEKAEFEDGGLS